MDGNLIPLAALLGSGFIVGLKHAFDADHIAAMATIVSGNTQLKESLYCGVAWGGGHTLTLLITGTLLLGFKLTIPPDLVQFFELLIGLLLLFLGIRIFAEEIVNKFQGSGVGFSREHAHHHEAAKTKSIKSFSIGMLHGLAGSAAIMLLILSSVQSVLSGILYILVFGIGSLSGMLLFSGMLGMPLLMSLKGELIHRQLQITAGAFSIVIGIIIIHEFFNL